MFLDSLFSPSLHPSTTKPPRSLGDSRNGSICHPTSFKARKRPGHPGGRQPWRGRGRAAAFQHCGLRRRRRRRRRRFPSCSAVPAAVRESLPARARLQAPRRARPPPWRPSGARGGGKNQDIPRSSSSRETWQKEGEREGGTRVLLCLFPLLSFSLSFFSFSISLRFPIGTSYLNASDIKKKNEDDREEVALSAKAATERRRRKKCLSLSLSTEAVAFLSLVPPLLLIVPTLRGRNSQSSRT